jgi:hypothetical protein
MPCSFGLLPIPGQRVAAQPIDVLEVTVIDRYIPLVTAPYGTWVARPARTTRLARGGEGSQLSARVRFVLGDDCFVGKSPKGLAAGGTLGPQPLQGLLAA